MEERAVTGLLKILRALRRQTGVIRSRYHQTEAHGEHTSPSEGEPNCRPENRALNSEERRERLSAFILFPNTSVFC